MSLNEFYDKCHFFQQVSRKNDAFKLNLRIRIYKKTRWSFIKRENLSSSAKKSSPRLDDSLISLSGDLDAAVDFVPEVFSFLFCVNFIVHFGYIFEEIVWEKEGKKGGWGWCFQRFCWVWRSARQEVWSAWDAIGKDLDACRGVFALELRNP